MLNKISLIAKYAGVAILGAVTYGYVAYAFIYLQLAGGSMLYAYLWNMAFIIAMLILDKIIHSKMQSRDFLITKKSRLFWLWMHVENFVSFKSTIYLFYIFILVISRVSTINPKLISADFRNFVLSIEYGLVLVVAFDKLTEHIFKDIKRVKVVSAKFRIYRTENKG